MSLGHFPPNPSYGRGCFRRLIVVRRTAKAVLATIDDTHHAIWVMVDHDGHAVTRIEGGITRGPATTCCASTSGLTALVGHRLNGRPASRELSPSMNCTHLADLATWAIARASDGSFQTTYEVSVPDEIETPVWASVSRDGLIMHKWLIRNHRVLAPDTLECRPLLRGFTAWARAAFKGEELEAALMLQRGVFVARGRTRLVDLSPPVPLRLATGMADACYSYSGERLATANSNVGYVRDFTEGVVSMPPPAPIIERFEGLTNDRP